MFDPTEKNEYDLPLYPQLLPYGHTVGAPAFRPNDQKAVQARALTAMSEQVDAQLKMLREQAQLIHKQVVELEKRRIISHIIYQHGELKSDPCINTIYHLYKRADSTFFLTQIAPHEWGRTGKDLKFVASVKQLADNTWDLVSVFTDELQELVNLYSNKD